MESILKNIKEIRIQKGLSQEFVAEKLNLAASTYNLIENGKRKLYYYTILQIANIFEISAVDLITWPEKYVSTNIEIDNLDKVKASITIELDQHKKDQVLKLVFGKNSLEIFNK